MGPKRRVGEPRPDRVSGLINSRRRELGWSLSKLASAAGIGSPAYIFHIENGGKVPSEPVAQRLAEALGLDSALLMAWARLRGRGALEDALEAAGTLSRLLGAAVESTGLLEVPVLPEGTDPIRDRPLGEVAIETLRLDPRLLPPISSGSRAIGYRLSAHGARRVPEALRPGDCVVVIVGPEPPALDAPCAVRIGGRVEIARVRLHDGTVHLPSLGAPHDSEASGERLPGDPADLLVGRVVVAFHRWL